LQEVVGHSLGDRTQVLTNLSTARFTLNSVEQMFESPSDDWDGDLTLYDTSAESISRIGLGAGSAPTGVTSTPPPSGGPNRRPRSSSVTDAAASADVGPSPGPDARGSLVMRLYDDPVEVRRGLVNGVDAPAEFVWRGRLWVVHEVISHWMETGAWWVQAPAEDTDLIAEREVWRVSASRGRSNDRSDDDQFDDNGADDRPEGQSGKRRPEGSWGVFDLSFDWSVGHWQLTRAHD